MDSGTVAIIGIVVALVVSLIVLLICVICFCRLKIYEDTNIRKRVLETQQNGGYVDEVKQQFIQEPEPVIVAPPPVQVIREVVQAPPPPPQVVVREVHHVPQPPQEVVLRGPTMVSRRNSCNDDYIMIKKKKKRTHQSEESDDECCYNRQACSNVPQCLSPYDLAVPACTPTNACGIGQAAMMVRPVTAVPVMPAFTSGVCSPNVIPVNGYRM